MGRFLLDPIAHPNLILVVLFVGQICGLYYFTFGGFFVSQAPVRAFSPPANESLAFELPPLLAQPSGRRPFYDRLVFMVIDALRYDFVFGNASRFRFLNDQLARGQALGLISVARPPTVTLPRLKALTSGSISSFLDVILNFDTRELREDSWVERFHTDLKFRIHFYGDDTWLKLFPRQFQRSEGVTSFYVTDTVQVDLNVTRHLAGELASRDWDVMILHYLGLDHIGHCYGARNAHMDAKQAEMDAVIQSIHHALLREQGPCRTLFVICGDHGMTNGGNHGGSSYDESAPAAIFMSSHQSWGQVAVPPREVAQVDIVPTLSMLFGSSIPEHSNGRLIPELLPVRGVELLKYYYRNALQIFRSIGYYHVPSKDRDIFALKDEITRNHHSKAPQHFSLKYHLALRFHSLAWSEHEAVKRDTWLEEARFYYQEYLDNAYEYNSMTTSGFGVYQMSFGVLFLLLNALALIAFLFHLIRRAALRYRPSNLYMIVVQFAWIGVLANVFYELCLPLFARGAEPMDLPSVMPHVLLFVLLSLVPLQLMYIFNMFVDWAFFYEMRPRLEAFLMLLFVGSYILSLFSSSYIEEEYCFWYFWTATLACYFFLKRQVGGLVSLLSVLLFFRMTNDRARLTGTKKSCRPSSVLPSKVSSSLHILGIPLLMRLVMYWNYTGCLFEGLKDIKYYILQSPPAEDVLFSSSLLFFVFFCIWWHQSHPILSSVVTIRAAVFCFNCLFLLWQLCLLCLFKYSHVLRQQAADPSAHYCFLFFRPFSALQLAQTIYASLILQLLAMVLFASFTEENNIRASVKMAVAHSMVPMAGVLFLLLQKAYQSCHLVVFILQNLALGKLSAWISRRLASRSIEKTTGLLFQIFYFCTLRASYFLLGQSNLVATIDLSNAYTGLDGYYVGGVGVLLFLITWGGPLMFALFHPIVIHPAARLGPLEHVALPTAFLATMVSIFQLALVLADICFLNHLFIWSVFSPRHLYEMFWVLFYFLWMITYPICVSDYGMRD